MKRLLAAAVLVLAAGAAPETAWAQSPEVFELRSRVLRLESRIGALSAQVPGTPGPSLEAEALRQRIQTLELSVAAMQLELENLRQHLELLTPPR